MPVNLHGRNVLTLDDFSGAEIRYLLRLAAELKAAKQAGTEVQRLVRKNIALIFEKDFDPHPFRLRGCRLRPGSACHLYRSLRQPHRPQGIDEGHGTRARAHV